MLGRSNFLALVGGGRQPKFPQNKVGKTSRRPTLRSTHNSQSVTQVIIWDDIKHKAVLNLEFRSPVYSVRLSRTPQSRIVVALQNSVHIYAFSVPPEKLSVFETADNPLGLCCLGPTVVAFPGRTPGQVQTVELGTGNVSIIPAHGTPLRAMVLSTDGALLVTASEKGTLIRIFSTGNCSRIGELRRGVDPAIIFSVAISPNNLLLAVTSDKSTLHVFDLPSIVSHSRNSSMNSNRPQLGSNSFSSTGSTEEGNNQKWGILGKLPLLPRVFSDVYSFASVSFNMDDDPQTDLGKSAIAPIPGIPGGKPRKGVIGWKDDCTLLILGAGRDGRWEKFVLGEGDDGKRHLIRSGWKRYLGS